MWYINCNSLSLTINIFLIIKANTFFILSDHEEMNFMHYFKLLKNWKYCESLQFFGVYWTMRNISPRWRRPTLWGRWSFRTSPVSWWPSRAWKRGSLWSWGCLGWCGVPPGQLRTPGNLPERCVAVEGGSKKENGCCESCKKEKTIVLCMSRYRRPFLIITCLLHN